jgi:hypothetical protein
VSIIVSKVVPSIRSTLVGKAACATLPRICWKILLTLAEHCGTMYSDFTRLRVLGKYICTGLPDGIFKPKIPTWVNFGGPLNEKCWYVLCPFRIHYVHLVCIFYGELLICGNFLVHAFPPFWYIVSGKTWQPYV